jgi:hypothetical protein
MFEDVDENGNLTSMNIEYIMRRMGATLSIYEAKRLITNPEFLPFNPSMRDIMTELIPPFTFPELATINTFIWSPL